MEFSFLINETIKHLLKRGYPPQQLDILDFLFCIFHAELENINGIAVNILNLHFIIAMLLRF